MSSWVWWSKIVFGQQSASSDSLWHLNLGKSPAAPPWSVYRRSHLPLLGISPVTASWAAGKTAIMHSWLAALCHFATCQNGIPEDPPSYKWHPLLRLLPPIPVPLTLPFRSKLTNTQVLVSLNLHKYWLRLHKVREAKCVMTKNCLHCLVRFV